MDILKGLLAYAKTVGGASRPLLVNGSDELVVTIGSSTATQDVNVEEIAGSAVAATSVAGTMPVETDHRQVAGSVIATTGINGTFPVEGPQASGNALSTQYPILIGGEIVQVPTTKTNGHFWNSILDDYRRLWIRSAAFDTLTGADQVENLNTDGTDHGYFLIANETNIAQPATQYFPNSSGIEIGSRVNITILLLLEDITSVAFEFTNDPTLTSWEDMTASIMDPNTGANLYASTHWTEPGSGTPIVMAMHIRGLNAGSFRLAVVGSAAANTFAAHGYSGAL